MEGIAAVDPERDPRTTMHTLGHNQISLTLNTYTHVLGSLQIKAAAKMNAILSGE